MIGAMQIDSRSPHDALRSWPPPCALALRMMHRIPMRLMHRIRYAAPMARVTITLPDALLALIDERPGSLGLDDGQSQSARIVALLQDAVERRSAAARHRARLAAYDEVAADPAHAESTAALYELARESGLLDGSA